MNDGIFWVVYRDDSLRDLLTKVHSCLGQFERKMRMKANIVGVSSSLDQEAERRLEAEGMRVIHNLPAWAKSEIWVGHQDANVEV
uniref:Uncharacterized protein n=1 Tax=viral metagenome TaxID=1070528 RepID=A0A6H1ZE78_9ZZZZ